MSLDQVIEIVRNYGYLRLDAPVLLASGNTSQDFIDGKKAVSSAPRLKTVAAAMVDAVADVPFDCVGGLTMGADAYAVGVALHAGCDWFFVRKATKERGTNNLIEGCDVGGRRVLLVDDVVTTGGSIQQAFTDVTAKGGIVVAAVTLVDRGEQARDFFDRAGIPFRPLVTYRDLNIEPVGPAVLAR